MINALIFPLILGLGIWEVVIILAIILLIWGGTKIPELMRGLGKGVKSFKEGMKEGDEKVDVHDEHIKDVDSEKIEKK